jgi:VCBS repeat-containing protein
VLANDSDVDGDPLTAVLDGSPANGTLTLNADGSFTYTPNADFSGQDTFSYHASDGTADSNVAMVTITVNAVNNPPVADDLTVTTDEDTAAAITLTGSDPDGDPLTFSVVAGPSNGTLSGTPPDLTYTPNLNYNGPDSFTYRANDGQADSNTATVTIVVNAVNDPPTAVDDSYTTDEGTTLNMAAPGVLGNDSDPEGDPLTAVLVSGVSNGSLSLNSDGSLSYTPNTNFNGSDSFTYRANDGQADSDLATVSISVIAAPISVTDIQPNTMQAGTTTNVTITGSSFAAGANVTFENGNGPAPAAANIVVAPDGKSLTASITAKSGGPPRDRIWDVRVTNPDGSSAVLTAAFTVTP